MARLGRLLRCSTRCVWLATALIGGCMPFRNTVPPPPPDHLAQSACLPAAARGHVHVFFVHGMDPCDWANLEGVRDYVQALGYLKTHYGQLYHVWQFKDELLAVHRTDPEARFVLVGFSFGANMVREIAHAANDEHINIDLLIYLGGNTLENRPYDKPENALHIVNILATGCIWNGAELDGADNLNYADVWHFGSPAHPKTLAVLSEELAKVASRVPVVQYEPALPQGYEPAPTPRPVKAAAPGPRDEWDFLKPEQTLPR